MFADFRLIPRSASEKMLEVKLNETIGSILVQKESTIGIRTSKGRDQTLDSEVALEKEALCSGNSLFFHQMGIAEDLVVCRSEY